MGGVQIPRQWFNRLCFRYLERRAKAFYLRDFEGVEALEQRNHQKVSFFMDTSYYARDDRKDFRLVPQKYIILNMNSNAEHFFDEFLAFAKDYQRKGYHLYYVPISKGNDNDLQYYDRLLKDGISPQSLSLLDWETDFLTFLTCLVRAEKVIGTRLHLFLISSFLGVPTEVFPYQKKI